MSVPRGPSGQTWSLQCIFFFLSGEEGRTTEGNRCLYQEVHLVRDEVFNVIIRKKGEGRPIEGNKCLYQEGHQCNYKQKREEGRTIEGNKRLYQEVHQVRDGVFSVIIRKGENKEEQLKTTGVCTRRSIRSEV